MKTILLTITILFCSVFANGQVKNQNFNHWDEYYTEVGGMPLVYYKLPRHWITNGFVNSSSNAWVSSVSRIENGDGYACRISSTLFSSDMEWSPGTIHQDFNSIGCEKIEFDYKLVEIEGDGKFVFSIIGGSETLYTFEDTLVSEDFEHLTVDVDNDWIIQYDTLRLLFKADGYTFLSGGDLNKSTVIIDNVTTNQVSTQTIDLHNSSPQIYPNPNYGTISINHDAPISKVEIYNTTGQLLMIANEYQNLDISLLNDELLIIKTIDIFDNVFIDKIILRK